MTGAPAGAVAETRLCTNGLITVQSDTPTHLGAMCSASDRALSLMDECGLRKPAPVTISVSDLDPPTCLGLFHCGEATIEVLSPDMIEARRSETGVYSDIPADRLFESVIVHELGHAAMDQTPCPYGNCVATSEYFAYTFQLLDLSEEDRATVVPQAEQPVDVKRDQINSMLLFMAPDVFVRNVWGHVSSRGDICTQLRGVQDGIIVFDRFHP
ncbi:DUF6639 family protein [Marivita hallyeonensis]|uniref:DUF6639 family protein n=1 Tax=Marivita hallyeonensis TaxID=996342 RepID=UPI001C4A49F0|nr:DUF6639 family protein [Marivita hallyeonensis]